MKKLEDVGSVRDWERGILMSTKGDAGGLQGLAMAVGGAVLAYADDGLVQVVEDALVFTVRGEWFGVSYRVASKSGDETAIVVIRGASWRGKPLATWTMATQASEVVDFFEGLAPIPALGPAAEEGEPSERER